MICTPYVVIFQNNHWLVPLWESLWSGLKSYKIQDATTTFSSSGYARPDLECGQHFAKKSENMIAFGLYRSPKYSTDILTKKLWKICILMKQT